MELPIVCDHVSGRIVEIKEMGVSVELLDNYNAIAWIPLYELKNMNRTSVKVDEIYTLLVVAVISDIVYLSKKQIN